MQIIPLAALPNQKLTAILDGNRWDISVKLVRGNIAVSLTKNSAVVIQNVRVVGGARILQSRYQEDGNFAILASNESVLDYTQFGVTQYLVYISQAELAALSAKPRDLITAAFFNPLGELPLRFAPQGYELA